MAYIVHILRDNILIKLQACQVSTLVSLIEVFGRGFGYCVKYLTQSLARTTLQIGNTTQLPGPIQHNSITFPVGGGGAV